MLIAFLTPFLLAFLIPGIILAFALIRKGEIDFTLFILYAVVFGLASQFIIGLLIALTSAPNLDLKIQTIVVILFLLGAIIYFTKAYKISWWRENLRRIDFSLYDGITILITVVLLFFITQQIVDLKQAYFNPATDQYFWMARAESLIADPKLAISILFNTLGLSKATFPFFIASYIPFLSKDIVIYQQFILAWIFSWYAIWILAMARLGRALLPVPTLGLLTPLLLFAFNWSNYYLLSTGVVRQNIAIPLFFIGFLFIDEYHSWQYERKKRWLFIIIFLLVFYFVQIHTLGMFLLAIGIAKGVSLLFSKIRELKPTLYFLILSLALFSIIYYPKSLWNQPYLDRLGNMIILLALIGLPITLIYIILSRQKSKALFPFITGTIIASIFLIAPYIPNTIINHNINPLRFFLFLYPGIAILSLLPLSLLILGIKKHLSKDLSKIIIILSFLIATTPLLLKVKDQQSFVFLDMIEGRDSGIEMQNKKLLIKEVLLTSKKLLKNEVGGDILLMPGVMDTPYIQWIFAPKQIFVAEKCADFIDCLAVNKVANQIIQTIQVTNSNIVLVITKGEEKQIAKLFKSSYQSLNFTFYYN